MVDTLEDNHPILGNLCNLRKFGVEIENCPKYSAGKKRVIKMRPTHDWLALQGLCFYFAVKDGIFRSIATRHRKFRLPFR